MECSAVHSAAEWREIVTSCGLYFRLSNRVRVIVRVSAQVVSEHCWPSFSSPHTLAAPSHPLAAGHSRRRARRARWALSDSPASSQRPNGPLALILTISRILILTLEGPGMGL